MPLYFYSALRRAWNKNGGEIKTQLICFHSYFLFSLFSTSSACTEPIIKTSPSEDIVAIFRGNNPQPQCDTHRPLISGWQFVSVPERQGPHYTFERACVRRLMPAVVCSVPEEDESGCGGSGPGGHGCRAEAAAATPVVLHGERCDA